MAANFKLYFNNEDIRRIRLEQPSWEAFRNKLHQLYPEYSPELLIKYKDEEGDLITVTTSREWNSMLQTNDASVPVKLYINEPGLPVVLGMEKVEEQKEEVVDIIPSAEIVTEFVLDDDIVFIPDITTEPQQLALPIEEEEKGDEKTEPVLEQPQIPEQPAIGSPEKEEAPLSVLEMDVGSFLEGLQRQACAFLNPDQNEALKKAKEFFHSLVPEQNPPVMQELAGVVDSVKRAFSNGYDNLRDLPEFNDLLDLFSSAKDDDPKRWVSQLETLEAMGFGDSEINQALLVKYRGNMQRVVDALLTAA